jgi:hypothetical protein
MTDRERDLSVERWLRTTPVSAAQPDDCLDAETLAAWAEGLLDGSQRATAEAHASNCARCQAMLAVMVRTTPDRAAGTGSPIRKWLMMLGPPMAAAAAVALWFAVDRGPRAPVVDRVTNEQAKAEPAPGSPESPASVPAPVEADGKAPSPSADRDAVTRSRVAPSELADARKERETGPQAFATPPATVAPVNEKKDLATAKRTDPVLGSERLGAAAPLPTPPPAPPPAPQRPPTAEVQAAAGSRTAATGALPAAAPQQQANQTQNQAPNQAPNQNQDQTQNQSPPVQRQALEERVRVAEKPLARAAEDSAAARRAAGRGGAEGGLAETVTLNVRAKPGDFELDVASSFVRWRVVGGRTVQHSVDGGTTWTNQYTADPGVMLTSGTAPTPTVCWLVGRSGAILLTVDGKVWQRVTFPGTVDFAAVTASDARTATVTTIDDRQFATTDGGQTWTRR